MEPLVFRDALWVVPDEAAASLITSVWAEHLASRGGFFYAESGELPRSWRRRYLLIARHPYEPKAVVAPRQQLPWTSVSERIDPRFLAEYNRRRATS